ncbi:MAG: RNA polymerase sigma factor [Gammaproteobacteria bacterium]
MQAAEPADEELMMRYVRGDDAAFELLYRRHRGALYRYFLRTCANRALAEELYQDVWTRIIGARGNYRPTARFTTWMYTLAHNRMIDHHRRRGTHPDLDDPEGDSVLAVLPAPAADQPDTQVASARAVARIREAVDGLPQAQREAFLLRAEGDMAIDDIAAVTGVNRETAKSRLRYALAKLRAALGGAGDEP